MVNKFKLTPIC